MLPLPAIVRLVFRSSPSAIIGAVATTVVNAVEAVAFAGALPHIREEIFKRISPSVTDGDASASVVGPCCGSRISATLDHSSPRMVLDSAVSAMFPLSCASSFAEIAATAHRMVHPQVARGDKALVSAVAPTVPKSIMATVSRGGFNNHESSEPLAEKVNLGGHREPQLSGVMPRVVRRYAAALSFLQFTRTSVRARY